MGHLAYLIGVIIVLLTYFAWRLFQGTRYWVNKGIPGPSSLPIVGSFLPVLMQKVSLGDHLNGIYRKYKNERFIGLFSFADPTLMLTKLEDIEAVLITDFQYFMDRGPPINEEVNPHNINLFGLTGNRWRALRAKVTPTFTSGRIKGMVPQISECWKNVDNIIRNNKGPFELKDLSSTFTMDVIASVAFGLETKTLGADDIEFREKTKAFFNFSLIQLITFLINVTYPKLSGWLKMPVIPRNITNYFASITMNMIDYRRKNNIQRNDFLQLMMQLQDKSVLEVKWDAEDKYLRMEDKVVVESIEITENLIVSQAVLFFTAGYESTANTILFTLFEISRRPEIQERARKEVEGVISKNGSITYEALKEMVYLEQCVRESLRLHPVAMTLTRRCVKDYEFPGSNFKVSAGTQISIPVFGLQTDSKYWPDPFVYNPDRFGSENTIKQGTWMPFGDGPRMCIAMRFAIMEVKVGLAKILLNYDFQMHPDTEIPIRSNKKGFLNSPASPVRFNFVPRIKKVIY